MRHPGRLPLGLPATGDGPTPIFSRAGGAGKESCHLIRVLFALTWSGALLMIQSQLAPIFGVLPRKVGAVRFYCILVEHPLDFSSISPSRRHS